MIKTSYGYNHKGYSVMRTNMRGWRKWYVQIVHAATGIPYDEAECPKCVTLNEAREIIDELEEERIRYEA